MKQKDFAERIGTTDKKLYSYEAGIAKPNELLLSKIAKIAGITLEEIKLKDLKSNYKPAIKNPDTQQMEFVLIPEKGDIGEITEIEQLKEKIQKLEQEKKDLMQIMKNISSLRHNPQEKE